MLRGIEQMPAAEEYLFFDSTRRNRAQYPVPGNYTVFLEQDSGNTGLPTGVIGEGATGPLSVPGALQLPTTRQVGVQDFYAGWRFTIHPETRNVVSYNQFSNTVTLDVPFTVPVVSVPFTAEGRQSVNILDPVIGGIPYDSGTTAGGSLPASVDLGVLANTQDNYYINSSLEIGGEFRNITQYDGTTQTAEVSPPFIVPVVAVPWQVRYEPPVQTGVTLTAVSSLRAVSLAATTPRGLLSTPTSTSFVRMVSGVASGQVAQIQGYTGAPAHVASLLGELRGFTTLPAPGDSYEILNLTRDNSRPLHYRGSWASQNQPTCYAVNLKYLSLPNRVVFGGTGGLITSYPYVVVELEASNSSTLGTVYSNSPEFSAPGIKFVVPTDDYTATTDFVRLVNTNTTQMVKFKPTRVAFKVTVRLPGGEVLQFSPDTQPPAPPDRLVQVTALFSFSTGNACSS